MVKMSQKLAKASNVVINNTSPPLKVKRTRRTVPRDSPPQRSSIYRGVTRHRWTGRYEAHLWDKNCWNESQNKKGRQVYLGAYDDEEAAAHSYDLAALKYWGEETILNFPLSTYAKELREMQGLAREEYIGSLRRKSSGFSRGASKYRGVARHHHNGRWEARIGRVFGNKYLYLGTYATQEEAAVAYDMAAIEYRGLNAVTNFDLSRYIKWLRPDNTHSTPNPSPNPNPNPNSDSNFTTLSPNSDDQIKPCFHYHNHGSISPTKNTTMAQPTSALGLLLQSSKFKEMMQMTIEAECPAISGESEVASHHVSSFPDDIRTYFESDQDFGVYGGGNEAIFGDLNSFMFN